MYIFMVFIHKTLDNTKKMRYIKQSKEKLTKENEHE